MPGFALNALPRVNMRIDRFYRREIRNILECRALYRFGKNTVAFIVNLIHDKISTPTGSFLQVTGNTFTGLHKSTLSRVVRRVCLAPARKFDQFAKFPKIRQAKDEIKQGFYEHAGFPCIIGCVDGSHVRIIQPLES